MSLFRLDNGDGFWYTEADTMEEAIIKWKKVMKVAGITDEDPDNCSLLDQCEVIR